MVGELTPFAVDIDDAAGVGYDPDTRGQLVARWPAGVAYLRPATTPTSLGPPQPVRRLLNWKGVSGDHARGQRPGNCGAP